MCGIFGYYNRLGNSVSSKTLRAMGQVIQYRGPDDQGIFETKGVALGNQRLSIIDLQDGNQPFVSDDEQIVVVQNGEIFNHVELAAEVAKAGNPCRTKSDTEVLLRLYELEGINFIHKLNGMFAIAIYDQREKALYIIRDRIGIKPLYLHDDGIQITFASEIKSILKSGIPYPSMNMEALHHYLTFNYMPPPYTVYEGVYHLMPGHYMKFTPDKSIVQRWWNLAQVQPVLGRTEGEWIEEFNAILDDAVRIRLRSDVPFGAFLSGGVDSSTIVGLMAKHITEPVKTFCIGFDDPLYDESVFAQEASDRFKTNHIMERVSPDMLELWPLAIYHCDQPHGDISFVPTYRVSQLAAKHVKVVLTGDGGDELFAGYDKHKSFFAKPDISSMSDAVFRRSYFKSISLFSDTSKRELYKPELLEKVGNIDSYEVARPYFEEVSHQDRINQALYLDMQLLLSGNNLVKPDRMGMAVSLEARSPFLDYRMMEFAFQIPGTLKLNFDTTKYLYKKAVEPLIGNHLAHRKKQMFTVPVGNWFRESKRSYCEKAIESLREKTAIFEYDMLRKLLDEHCSYQKNRTRELRAIIAIYHWLNI